MPEPSPAKRAEPAPDRCAECGADVALAAALVYHGLVYHPACASGVRPRAAAPERWPFGVPEFNCTGDL
ncbi:MAG TPA: hypothetical protein VKV26_17280 [Dehalococcoidia bacterium]|nr:hypothetical protein [Dehalococcoidia bacterium]